MFLIARANNKLPRQHAIKFTVHTTGAAYLVIDNEVSIYGDDKIDGERYALRLENRETSGNENAEEISSVNYS